MSATLRVLLRFPATGGGAHGAAKPDVVEDEHPGDSSLPGISAGQWSRLDADQPHGLELPAVEQG
ncbi:hypothetical protein [Streptomyces chartreusis]|uniref:hypothetical protein n=1 Tax=Streptomyces chartreusis TaxID=1969 RepID=UPI00380D407F